MQDTEAVRKETLQLNTLYVIMWQKEVIYNGFFTLA